MKQQLKEQLFRLIWKLSGRRRAIDRLFSTTMRHRRHLREVDPRLCIPRFDETEIVVRELPRGESSSPILDAIIVVKAVIGFKCKNILELGSYRGNTALLIAQNTSKDVSITTVDYDPGHGDAYRGMDIAARIDRRVGEIAHKMFSPDEKFDLVFIDGSHEKDSVIADTKVAFSVLKENGVILWHDYQFFSYFEGKERVPEALKLIAQKDPVVALRGSWLAMHSRYPEWKTEEILEKRRPCQNLAENQEVLKGEML